MQPILFLDFDGVLHPEVFGAKEFSCAQFLEEALQPLPLIQIILSTSWKYDHSFSEMCDALPEGLRSRVVGQTVSLEKGMHPLGREKEIRATMEQFPGRAWIALDDWALGFREDTEQLFLVNKETGFTKNNAKELQERIQALLDKQNRIKP